MGALLFFALLALPIIELAVIVQVAEQIGVFETLALLVLVSVAGAWLLKQQGLATWRSLQETMARGEVPTREATDGALILFGGALLLTPGFVTDAVGILLLLAPTRAAVKGAFRKLFSVWAGRRTGAAGDVYSATVTRVRRSPRRDAPATSSGSPGRLPGEDPPAGEGGSPGRG
ncbi:MAG TPA: FxsA family protein [Actinomycetota bacterium]|nr:FxsA family protein [Actinomycetota bacterium]